MMLCVSDVFATKLQSDSFEMRLLKEKTIWLETKEGMQILSQDAAVEEEGQVCHKYTSGET